METDRVQSPSRPETGQGGISVPPQFTPGPWEASKGHFGIWWIGKLGSHTVASVNNDWYDGGDKVEANAHLIAAAPELLAACEALSDWLGTSGDKVSGSRNRAVEMYRIVSAAIARATGGQS